MPSALDRIMVGAQPVSLVLRATGVLVLLYGGSSIVPTAAVRLVCVLIVILPGALRSPGLWFLAAGAIGIDNVLNWSTVDNHKYLIFYWTLTCALGTWATDTAMVLRHASRLLTGTAFFLAVGWKLIAGQYLDGTFFYWTLLTDRRVGRLAAWLGDESYQAWLSRVEAIDLVAVSGAAGTVMNLELQPTVWLVAFFVGWFGLTLEGINAFVQLLRGEHWAGVRHAALGTFVVTTYVVLPVVGFGTCLLVLGLAQCHPHQRRLMAAYICGMALLQVSTLPWQAILLR